MKKLLAGICALVMAAILTVPAFGTVEVLDLNGRNLWQEAKSQMINGTTYVSLRTMANELAPNAEVSWEKGVAWIRGDGLTVKAKPGELYLTVNDRVFYLPDGVRMGNGSVLVPVRAIAKALGGTVDWSAQSGVSVHCGNGTPGVTPYTKDELYWMARIISAESRGEPLLGKIAVGTVVLNRVASDEFPDTIYDVIFDRKWGIQFEPVANGTIYYEPAAESVLAAKMVLDGARVAGDSLYFLAPELTKNHWIMKNCNYVTTIGCHWFYR